MDNIIYEDETVKEVVFEGDLVLDGHMSEKEQKQHIFRLMRKKGIKVENESEFSIGYEGAEDDNGISETQISHYVVTRTYQKPVPYKVTYEEVFQGEWILDGLSISPEEQRRRIFEEMHKAGIHPEDEENLQIGYEGVEDNEGISETQTSRYVVYRVHKERVSESVEKILLNDELDSADKMKMIHDELVSLREKVRASTDSSEISLLSDKIAEVSDLLDLLVEQSSRDYAPFEEALKELEEQIKKIQDKIADNMKEYLESYERIQNIMKEQTDTFDSSLSEEELAKRVDQIVQDKMSEDEDAISVRDEIDEQLQLLKDLVKKRDKVRKDFETAKSLGISALEYKELTDNFRSRNLVNAIIERKGLGDLLKVPAKERTAEQKRQIRAVRQEIFEELVEAKKNHENQSILSLVEALYGLETEVKLVGKQRVLIVKPRALENLKNNASKMPEKIINRTDTLPTYQPGDAPKDMIEVMEKRKEEGEDREELFSGELIVGEEDIYDVILRDHGVDIRGDENYTIGYEGVEDNQGISETQKTKYVVYRKKEKEQEQTPTVEEEEDKPDLVEDENGNLIERITIFSKDSKFYVRKPVFARFDVEPIGREVRIENTACYEIRPEDVIEITRNADNDVSPYMVTYRDALEVVDEPIVQEKEIQEERGDTMERITIFTGDDGKYYARKPVFARFDVEPMGEEVRIENTACYEIHPMDVIEISRNATNDVSPYFVEYRDGEVVRNARVDTPAAEEVMASSEEPVERITIFDGNDGKKYVRKPVFDRFDMDPIGEEVRIENTACHEIHPVDALYIENNANNDYSPYVVEHRGAEVVRNTREDSPIVEDEASERKESVERITIFTGDDGKLYVRKPVFARFDIDPVGEEVRIENTACQEIRPADVVDISRNATNDVSPYEVVYRDGEVVRNTRDDSPVVEDVMASSEGPVERVTIFDGEDGKKYVRKPVFDRFDVDPIGPEVRIENTACQEIHPNDVSYIEANANNTYSPYVVEHRGATILPSVDESMDREVVSDESDEYIAGTNIKKPRARGIHETDEEYVAFLRDYYGRVFGKEEEKKEPPKVEDTNEIEKPIEKFTIFRDVDHPDQMYAREPVFERFDIEPLNGQSVRIEGALCHPIPQAAVDYMIQNANNATSPYVVEYRDIRMDRQVEETPTDAMENRRGLMDRLVIFRDPQHPNKYYIRKPAFERFDVTPIGNEVRLDGVAGYEVSPVDISRIVQNQNNDVSPYIVEYRDTTIDRTTDLVPPTVGEEEPRVAPPTREEEPIVVPPTREEEPIVVPPTVGDDPKPGTPTTSDEEEKTEIITLYRDLNDNNQIYAPEEVLRRFGIEPHEEPTNVEGVPCHKISRDTDQIIHSIARMNRNPRLEVQYKDVHIKEIKPVTPKPHVEEILDKVTTGLDIRAKDQKRYAASNLRVAKGFRDELHSGNYAYNIVHVVPASLKAGVGFFRKLSGKIMTTDRARDAMETIEKRLQELSDEELEVLFEEYKGSQLKTDMNNQINPLILDRLRQFGLQKVEKLNAQIREDYAMLFTLVGQIRALEKKLARTEKNAGSLENQRQTLLAQASERVRSILDSRRFANNILSSGVHGLEEDFKAVATKLSYVGMRFGKTNDFDNELQHQLGDFGKKLNTALANGNDEEIVENFMGLESCYYKHTDIQRSLLGRRSVGSKYYTPMAEQFDYRDDPFIRDLFTTVAVTSAAVSAINAVRVHQIEAGKVQTNQDQANAYNQATIDYVRRTGQEISGKRTTFREGMEAQAHQDVLTNAATRERAQLDLTGWKFNDTYHAADAAGHAAYNQFHADVTSQINAVTSDYAQGLITQGEALSRMAQISSDAQATLVDVVDSSLAILRQYASTHPQFDLSAFEESMQYIVAHPSAIADMNQAIVETTNLADGLTQVSYMPLQAIGSLPSDMASTIVCAASAAILAANVSNTMSKAGKKGTYGNEVTDMMDEYLSQQEVQESESRHR